MKYLVRLFAFLVLLMVVVVVLASWTTAKTHEWTFDGVHHTLRFGK